MPQMDLKKVIQDEIKQIPEEQLEDVLKIIRAFRHQQNKPNKILGLFKDDADIIDEISKEAIEERSKQVLREIDE